MTDPDVEKINASAHKILQLAQKMKDSNVRFDLTMEVASIIAICKRISMEAGRME